MEKVKMLVVDDNVGMVDVIKEYFKASKEIEVKYVAYDGSDAIDVFFTFPLEYKTKSLFDSFGFIGCGIWVTHNDGILSDNFCFKLPDFHCSVILFNYFDYFNGRRFGLVR